MTRRHLVHVLHLDAVACAAMGAALLLAAGALVAPAGLTAGWPIVFLGVLLVGYGLENLLVARRTSRGGLTGLAAVDLAFAGAALAVAASNPTGAEAWVQGVLVVVAVASVGMGALKLAGRRTLTDSSRQQAVAA